MNAQRLVEVRSRLCVVTGGLVQFADMAKHDGFGTAVADVVMDLQRGPIARGRIVATALLAGQDPKVAQRGRLLQQITNFTVDAQRAPVRVAGVGEAAH